MSIELLLSDTADYLDQRLRWSVETNKQTVELLTAGNSPSIIRTLQSIEGAVVTIIIANAPAT
jgi:hypothetical protein